MTRSLGRGATILALLMTSLGSGCHERHPVAVVDGPMLGRAPHQKVDFRQSVPSLIPRQFLKVPEVRVYRTRYRQATEVVFSHKTHSKDYDIGCARCHHGESCGRCHGRQERTMPVIESKAALHQSCVTCHQEMKSGPVACDDCHKIPGKVAPASASTPGQVPAREAPAQGATPRTAPERSAPAPAAPAPPT